MRKIFTLLTVLSFIVSCSSSEEPTPVPTDPVKAEPPIEVKPPVELTPEPSSKISLQYKVSGTSKLVSINFINANCKTDSIVNTILPYTLTLDDVKCDSTGIVVKNEKVNGGITLELWVNGKLSETSGSNSPRATSQISYTPQVEENIKESV